MKLSILAGSTSQSINIFISDSSSTTGAGKTAIAFNTSGLTAYYSFAGANATATAITLATLATVTTAWASGGFKELDATNMPGWYRLDIPNAVLATTKGRSVALHLQGVANMAPCPIEIELTGWDNQDAVHGGMSALPNTAVTTNASLLTSGTGTDQVSVSAGKILLQATQAGVTIPTVTTVTNQLTAAAIATGVWQDSTAGDFTVASSMGKALYVANVVPGAAGGHFIAGTNAATVITTGLTTTFTGNLTGSVASVTSLAIKKNTALANFEFMMTDSTNHAPVTGKTVTCTRSIDGGAFATGTLANVAEVSNGIYRVDFGAGDLNGNVITLRATATTSDDTFVTVTTNP